MKRIALIALIAAALSLPASGADDLLVIVHAGNPAAFLSRVQVSRMFLRKETSWPSGATVEPIDQPGNSPARIRFNELVHERSSNSLRLYWQQQVFSGRATPPPERASDAEVVAFVSATPGAIGYVSTKASLQGVRAVAVGP